MESKLIVDLRASLLNTRFIVLSTYLVLVLYLGVRKLCEQSDERKNKNVALERTHFDPVGRSVPIPTASGCGTCSVQVPCNGRSAVLFVATSDDYK